MIFVTCLLLFVCENTVYIHKEYLSLGGTPYADVATSDVGNRVMRGHRLPQLQCVDDDLYQLMLQCWQLDLDERPTFQEITHILENMLEDSTVRVICRTFSIEVVQL